MVGFSEPLYSLKGEEFLYHVSYSKLHSKNLHHAVCYYTHPQAYGTHCCYSCVIEYYLCLALNTQAHLKLPSKCQFLEQLTGIVRADYCSEFCSLAILWLQYEWNLLKTASKLASCITNHQTSWSRVLFEKLVKKVCAFYRTWRLIAIVQNLLKRRTYALWFY